MALEEHETELTIIPYEPPVSGDAYEVHHGEIGGRAPLARLLTEAGLVTDDQIRAAVEEGARTGERFGEVLLRRGAVTEEDLAHLLADQWGLPFVENPGPAGADLPADRAREIPAAAVTGADERPVIALADPTEERFEQVRSLLGPDVSFIVVTQATLDRLLGELSGGAGPDAFDVLRTDYEAPSALADARRGLGTIGEALELLEAAVDFAEQQSAELAALRSSLADSERRLESLAQELDTERGRVAEIEAERGRVAGLEAQLAERDRQLAERDKLLADIRAALADLQGTLESR
jgi:hypothetical protein